MKLEIVRTRKTKKEYRNKTKKDMNMRISIANIFTHLFLLLALLATASCSDWTDQKTVDIDPQHAKEQNPELWTKEKSRRYQGHPTYRRPPEYTAGYRNIRWADTTSDVF